MRIPVGGQAPRAKLPRPAPPSSSSSAAAAVNPYEEPNNSEDEEGGVAPRLDMATAAANERRFEERLAQRSLEIKRMLEDGNCLFRSVADRVYGDAQVRPSPSQSLSPVPPEFAP